jgi:hypothetical protein
MTPQESKAYSDYYEVSEHYPDFDDYAEWVDEAVLGEFVELYCYSSIADELGENVSMGRILNWWSNQPPEYKNTMLSEAYKEGWRVELLTEIREESARDAAFGY